jgi:hypothetical protein
MLAEVLTRHFGEQFHYPPHGEKARFGPDAAAAARPVSNLFRARCHCGQGDRDRDQGQGPHDRRVLTGSASGRVRSVRDTY